MEPTLQRTHPPTVEPVNLDGGDVVLCHASARASGDPTRVDTDRVAFIARLGSRSDLEWLIRALLQQTDIRHVVLCGDDPRATGDALLAIWRGGLDPDLGVPGPRGRLSPDLDPSWIEALRADVTLTDLRDESPEGVATALTTLPAKRTSRESVVVPDPEVPSRTAFLSRTTSFPIFSSDVGDAWLQLLNLALRIGTTKGADGDRFAEALNAMVTIETPVLEDGAFSAPDDFPAFLDVTADDFERRYLPHHGTRLRDMDGVDQLEAVRHRLERSPDTRSATIVALEPAEPVTDDGAPDLVSATCNVVDGKLFATFVLRRSDLYTDWPLEAAALVRVQREMADDLGLDVGSATFVIHAAYLREHDFARATRVLKEWFKRPLPLHVDPSGVFLFGSDADGARAMLLNHDASEIFWEDAFEDPEDLSWYIVDVMPWLLPQHIRYVGQECASLMRAIQVGECYLQG